MDNLDWKILHSILNYFELLSYKGIACDVKVEHILLLCCIDDFIEAFHCLITDEDYDYISKVLACIDSDCLVPYRIYKQAGVPENMQLDYWPYYFGASCDCLDS